MRKMVEIDTAALKGLELLTTDRKVSLQDLVVRRSAICSRSTRRPETTKELFAQSPKGSRAKPKAA
jgi:hypothetical protein